MSKDHAEHRTDAQIRAEIEEIKRDIETGRISEDEAERNAYFTDPANAEEVKAMFARMELVEALYKARQEAADKHYDEGGNLANEAIKIAIASRDIQGLEGLADEALQREAADLAAFCRDMASNAVVQKEMSFDQAKGANYDQRKAQIDCAAA